MEVRNLRQLTRAQTFRPFTLVFTDDDTIKIEHPEHLMAVDGEPDVVILVPGGGWRIVDSRAVREIQMARSNGTP